MKENKDMVRFCKNLIEFRKNQPTLRRDTFLTGTPTGKEGWPDVSWYSPLGVAVDWHSDELPIICLLSAPGKEEDPKQIGRDILLMFNSSSAGCRFLIPAIAKSKAWRLFIDTAMDTPNDIYPEFDGPLLAKSGSHTMPFKSLAVYIAEPKVKA
jgi:glycogen operon protein